MDGLDFSKRPILVFWETTKACLLACKHCRADAEVGARPGELSHEEGMSFIESLTEFSRPYPVLIMTGGDVLQRPDAFELVDKAKELGIPVGLAPSVTPNLNEDAIRRIAERKVNTVSISLDGATARVHDSIRGVPGHFEETLKAIRRLVESGIQVQVNTVVMRDNVDELPALVEILRTLGVPIWEVFFLIPVGRGQNVSELSPTEIEDVLHFLYDASLYGMIVRTVEGPFFRRVAFWRSRQDFASSARIAKRYGLGKLYLNLSRELEKRIGEPTASTRAQTRGTRDGKGIIFVAHDGTVYPSGFLPMGVGNIRESSLADIYRNSPLLMNIRDGVFGGRCGRCAYSDLCGGSRSRAYAVFSDALGEDPACAYSV